MTFFKNLFRRSKDDDDEDLADDEAFGLDDDGDDDDRLRTQAIMDDEDDLVTDSLSSDDEDDFDTDSPSGDEEHFGTSGELSNDGHDDNGPVAMGGSDYEAEPDDGEETDDEVDFDGFDDDDGIDLDDEEVEGSDDGGGSKKMLFAAAGIGVLLLGIAGGGSFWYFGSDATEQAVGKTGELDGGVQMALPPRSGSSLNALSAGGDDQPTETLETNELEGEAERADQSDDQPKDAAAQSSEIENLIMSSATLGSSGLNAMAGSGAADQGVIIPSVTAASFRKAAAQPKQIPLAKAPARDLLEKVEGLKGPLPTVSKDGEQRPWEVYARPLTGNEQGQRVGILVTGVGLSRAATMAAINKLPGEVSLVFEPYGPDLKGWLLRARLAGHEVFVGLPMESENFPAEDPGPLALSTTVQVAENMKRLHSILSSFAGYVGVVSTMGSKFSEAEGQLKPILVELKKRGLMFVDGGAIARSVAPQIAVEIDLPRAKNNLTLDDPPSPENVSKKLRQLEKLIKSNTTAIATIRAYPSSIEKLAEWIGTLSEKQLALVPVSAIANKQLID